MNNGKFYEVLRKNAHWIIICVGVLCGIVACVSLHKGNSELVVKNNKVQILKSKTN